MRPETARNRRKKTFQHCSWKAILTISWAIDVPLKARSLTFRRSLQTLRTSLDGETVSKEEIVKDHLLRLAAKLQKRYPFRFAKAFRGLRDEQNRWIQERLLTYYLFGALAELSGMEDELVQKAWILGTDLSKTVGKGGEHFRPPPFEPGDRALAREIGEKNFELLLDELRRLAGQVDFKLGAINPAEHTIAWCFRYLRLLLQAAKWESAQSR